MLDLHKLHIFSVVVQLGSFSAAAERLYVTQSAVSQHIKELETSLGVQLFNRGWRGVSLTQHGEVLSDYTTRIFELVNDAENALTDIDHLLGGRVRIGATPGVGVYLAPHWVQRFREGRPQMTVALQTGVTAQIVGEVLRQGLDVGIVEGELAEPPSTRISSLILDEVEQSLVVGPKHPFWQRDEIDIKDLQHHSLTIREPQSQSRVWLEGVLRQNQIEPMIGAEFDNLESMKRAVSVGVCYAVLPDYVVQSEVKNGALRIVPIAGNPFKRTLKLIWEASTAFSPITRAFLTELSRDYPAIGTIL